MQVTTEAATSRARCNGAGTGAATTNLVLPAAGVPPGWRRPVHGQQKPVARTHTTSRDRRRRPPGIRCKPVVVCLKTLYSPVRIYRYTYTGGPTTARSPTPHLFRKHPPASPIVIMKMILNPSAYMYRSINLFYTRSSVRTLFITIPSNQGRRAYLLYIFFYARRGV